MIVKSIIEDVTEGIDSLDMKYKAEICMNSEKSIIFVDVCFSSIGCIVKMFNIDDIISSKLPISGLVRYHFNKEIAKHHKKVGESK